MNKIKPKGYKVLQNFSINTIFTFVIITLSHYLSTLGHFINLFSIAIKFPLIKATKETRAIAVNCYHQDKA